MHPVTNNVINSIDVIVDHEVQNLSGGRLLNVALALGMDKPTNVNELDEPIMQSTWIADNDLVLEHDFSKEISDRVIVITFDSGCSPSLFDF